MCRSADFHGYSERERLKIKAFFIRFSGLSTRKPLPELLTLLYLPRISETALEVDGSKIRPDSPAFVTLYRIVNAKPKEGEAIYASRERVRASEGVRFEVYLREEKALKGIFRKDEEGEWKLECRCEMEEGDCDVAVAEVCVAVEGHVAMRERVGMVKKRTKQRMGFDRLEEIPEEREGDSESDGECCCSSEESEGGDDVDWAETDMEGVKWAVDVVIWVMCLGVGYLVSKASAKRLARKRIFF